MQQMIRTFQEENRKAQEEHRRAQEESQRVREEDRKETKDLKSKVTVLEGERGQERNRSTNCKLKDKKRQKDSESWKKTQPR